MALLELIISGIFYSAGSLVVVALKTHMHNFFIVSCQWLYRGLRWFVLSFSLIGSEVLKNSMTF